MGLSVRNKELLVWPLASVLDLLSSPHNCGKPSYGCHTHLRDGAGADMAQGDWALPRTGLLSLKGYALTPQAFSISNLVLGPVLHHPGKTYFTTLGAVIITGRAGTRGDTFR